VANRLVDPRSKLATVDWQETVAWPCPGALTYPQFLRAMDVLQRQKKPVEEGLFGRVRELFSVPLHIVWYDLTSSYFEGDGVCELAAYGYSRDHRPDRSQVVLGLALTQEGFPVAHDLFAGNTADVRTVKDMATQLRDRFGFARAVVVGDRGLLSAENAAALDELGLRYVLALRTHQHARVPRVVAAAVARGLARPRDVDAPWSVQEVAPLDGVRHVVVYSAFRAAHDRVVRSHRLKRTRDALARLRQQVADGKLGTTRAVTARVTRILSQSKVSRFFPWGLVDGRFTFRLDRTVYRTQRQLDGIYVLVSNAPDLATEEIVAAYRQLHAVEDAFRVLKSLVKLRPIYHWTQRRVAAHVFICVLAYLLAKVLEHRLARARVPMTAARALDALASVQAVEHRWGEATVTQLTRPSPEAAAILQALGLSDRPRIISVEAAPAST
jgi:transposase